MPNSEYVVLNKCFKTKIELKDYINHILNKYFFNEFLKPTDFEFIIDILRKHPHGDEKIGIGVAGIRVVADSQWGKRRFEIIRLDGSYIYFTYD